MSTLADAPNPEELHAPDSSPHHSPAHHLASDTKGRHLIRAAIVGLLAGLLALAFRWALIEAELSRSALLARLHRLPNADYWAWLVLPLIGLVIGSVVGWMMRFSPDAGGSGVPHLKGVLLHARSIRWRSLLPVKFVGGVLGIGAGLSLGREGPTVQMGAAVAQVVADVLRVPPRAVPQLLTCGAGAGLAAAFNAPLAGFLFVLEELHRELSARTFAGALVAALVADIVTRALAGELPAFAITGYPAIPLPALPIAALIGVSGGMLAVFFNRSLLRASDVAQGFTRVPRWLLPGLACALCGFVAWWLPDAVGGGHFAAERILSGSATIGFAALALLFGAKFLLTVLSYASGSPGGIFAPMLLLGAICGIGFGQGAAALFPGLAPHVTAFAILGMAAFFTGSVRAPLTGIVLIVEMTGNYQQLLALGITCLIADLVAGALRDRPIYESLLEADMHRRSSAGRETAHANEARSIHVGIQNGSALVGTVIRDCGLPKGFLITTVERAGLDIIPQPDLTLRAGDHLTILFPADQSDHAMRVVSLAHGVD